MDVGRFVTDRKDGELSNQRKAEKQQKNVIDLVVGC